jgi:pyruvate/2-oxoglutarate/acetoin dehydrogenase E1 component
MLWQDTPEVTLKKLGGNYGSLVVSPTRRQPNVTIAAYGGTARELADRIEQLFVETDCVAELIAITRLHPLDISPILRSASRTGTLIVVEDGSCAFGIGSEVLAQVAEAGLAIDVCRIGAEPVPIPSIGKLENEMLPTYERVVQRILKFKERLHSPACAARS